MKAPAEVIFAQNLASNDKVIRDRAVKKLKKWLGSRSTAGKYLSEEEMMKIWKGLHYCYWMSDKPLVQEELADNIAKIVYCFKHEESSVTFFKCFLVTIGREWFGIDRLRMDKFMMLVRRCLRHMLVYVKDRAWEVAVVERLTSILENDVMMAEAKNTSLGFQLHVADVFLEELAKIGAESVSAPTVTNFLRPFIKVLVSSKEGRLRDHVAERIFHHLIRQSDLGIEWAVNDEMEGADQNDVEDMEEDKDEDKDASQDELTADPRAGGVDVTLPQIQVDYQGLAQLLFELGSGNDVRKANRELLYKLSKNFKDVTQEVFPLGPDLDHDQEIEKISVKKAAKRLKKSDEEYEQLNRENKVAFKLSMKEQKKGLAEESLTNGEKNGPEDSHSITDGNYDQNCLKRHAEDESDDEKVKKKSKADDNITSDEKPNFNYKEKRKKQKQEQRRRKRERKLKEEADIAEKGRKSQALLDKDLEFKIAIDVERKDSKIESTNSNMEVEPSIANVSEKIKKKKRAFQDKESKTKYVIQDTLHVETEKAKQKKKKIKAGVQHDSDILGHSTESTVHVGAAVTNNLVNQTETESTNKMKERNVKDGENPTERSIAGNLGAVEDKVTHLENGGIPETETEISKKKNKDTFKKIESEVTEEKQNSTEKTVVGKIGNVEDKVTHVENGDISETVSDRKKKNKDNSNQLKREVTEEKFIKRKKDKTENSGEVHSNKIFEETDWDSPLKPGESEIVLPNKKYRGKHMLKPATEAPEGFPGFDPPSIIKTTPKSSGTMTASFLKKAMSKSASPKLKKSKLKQLKKQESLTMSEPKKKKVNFALTMNKSQDINAFITSIASSPSVPHDPNKHPAKPLLSGQDSTPDRSKRNSVAVNTQINSKSKTAKKLVALTKGGKAMDFF